MITETQQHYEVRDTARTLFKRHLEDLFEQPSRGNGSSLPPRTAPSSTRSHRASTSRRSPVIPICSPTSRSSPVSSRSPSPSPTSTTRSTRPWSSRSSPRSEPDCSPATPTTSSTSPSSTPPTARSTATSTSGTRWSPSAPSATTSPTQSESDRVHCWESNATSALSHLGVGRTPSTRVSSTNTFAGGR